MPRNSNNTKRKMDLGEDVAFPLGNKRSKTSTSSAVSRSKNKNNEEPPASFNQRKCITWFKTYTSASSPEVIGMSCIITMHSIVTLFIYCQM
jgi:hypothetical protein